MRGKTIKIPLYFGNLKVVISHELDDESAEAYVDYTERGPVLYIKPDASAEIIAHESVHIANHTFKRCGIKPDLDNDEPQAYLVGWVVDQITKTINKFNETVVH